MRNSFSKKTLSSSAHKLCTLSFAICYLLNAKSFFSSALKLGTLMFALCTIFTFPLFNNISYSQTEQKKIMKNIVSHLWFDKEAVDAAKFYVSLFPDSKLSGITTIGGTPSGNVDILSFSLSGTEFMAINAGPMFKINKATSFFVYCGSDSVIEDFYSKLTEGGSVLMPLDKYDWSSKYAWVEDKYGVSWQLDVDPVNSPQKIVPALLFVNEKVLKVKEAVDFYASVFPESKILLEAPYDKSAGLPEDSLLFAQIKLSGHLFNLMSGPMKHDFDFNEAVSFMVYCDSQEEIDYYWEKLTAGGQEQPCGWVKDKFGVSWQVVPSEMEEMMATKNKEQLDRVTAAMLKMKKFDIEKLKKAFKYK
jgi:predicted 3-demethylubiquinone-9 3-methyltransferase (glyoxalase superfamily)